MTLPLTVDYRLLQTGSAQLTLIADCELWMLEHCREALNALFIRRDIAVGQLIWSLELQTVPVSLQPSGGALCVSGAGMSNSLLRLKQMLLGWGTVGVIYNFSDYLQGEGYQLTPSIIDNLIAFSLRCVAVSLVFSLCR